MLFTLPSRMKFLENPRLQVYFLMALACLLYVQTLRYDFVLDDEAVIVRNAYVQNGIKGIPSIFALDTFAGYERVGEGENILTGGRYRPFSVTVFALLFFLFGSNSFVFHALSILLYAGCTWIMFRFMQLVLKKNPDKNLLSFITVLLFTVHPVHTEVVANIKSCDELFSFFFGMCAVYALFKSYDLKKTSWLVVSGFFLFLACLSKENAITFLLTGPLALWYFRKSGKSAVVKSSLPFFIAVVLFLILRGSVIGWNTGQSMHDPLNNPFLAWNGHTWEGIPVLSKVATILYVMGLELKLMVLPFPLTHDYYPLKIALKSFSHISVWISLLIIIGLLFYGIKSLFKKEIPGFGILFFFITFSITANIFFPVGTFMAERFLFLPSAGFCIAIASAAINTNGKRNEKWVLILVAIVSSLFSILTINRNGAWKNNETLFKTDLEYSSQSIKLQNDYGTLLLTKALQEKDASERKKLLTEAYNHLKEALELHKTYYDAYLAFGAAAYYLEHYKESVEAYRTAMELSPSDPKAKTGLIYALQAYASFLAGKTDLVAAISFLEEAWQLQPDLNTAKSLALYYNALKQSDKEIEWLEKVQKLAPDDRRILDDLTKAHEAYGK